MDRNTGGILTASTTQMVLAFEHYCWVVENGEMLKIKVKNRVQSQE